MTKVKMTTTTTLVMEALQRADDFLTVHQLCQVTGRSNNRVTAALHSLKGYQAIEAMDVGGRLYWYATPKADTRVRTVEEKVEEVKPRKSRRARKPHQDLLS